MNNNYQLHLGDCIDVMRTMTDNTIDSIVCDPPYELGFMGKSWDSTGIAYRVDMWSEALRVLKPGGHMLAFSGSRTYHRMAVAIEDAGFEIRDQIQWIYGSGFPKSHDVSKGIDKSAGAEREAIGIRSYADGHIQNSNINKLSPPIGTFVRSQDDRINTAPATAAAKQWQGWGTALKPAHEPICMARKPLIGTVAQNVLAHGTGAINVDGCRVEGIKGWCDSKQYNPGHLVGGNKLTGQLIDNSNNPSKNLGRWPANIIHDGSDEVLAGFPETKSGGGDKHGRKSSSFCSSTNWEEYKGTSNGGDSGSAARFFYCAKASKSDRNSGGIQSGHPTVKPTTLMRYLCRLVTPPGGTVLDPFMGSGSTGKAAVMEGFKFIGIDITPEYVEIARARIGYAVQMSDDEPEPQMSLL